MNPKTRMELLHLSEKIINHPEMTQAMGISYSWCFMGNDAEKDCKQRRDDRKKKLM